MTYSLHTPLPGLTWFQRLLRPLIFMQLRTLKLWVRKHFSRGVPYRIQISPVGRVYLVRMPIDIIACTAAETASRPVVFDFSTGIVRREFLLVCAPQPTPRAPAPEGFVRMGMESGLILEPHGIHLNPLKSPFSL